MELINGSDKEVVCDVTMTLNRATPPGDTFRLVRTTQHNQIAIPAHARHGFRVAEPLTYGRYRVNYEVKIDDRVLVADYVEFLVSGTCRVVNLRPYSLSRDAA